MKWLAVIFALASTSALAQQQPDPAFLQRAITAVQTQRNLAMDAQAVAEAKVSALTEELTKAQARIKELETKAPAEEPAR